MVSRAELDEEKTRKTATSERAASERRRASAATIRSGDRRRSDRVAADRRAAVLRGAATFSAAGSSGRACWPIPQILSDTVDALRDAQYAPVLAANRAAIETPFASSWKGAAKPEVTLVEFFDYACPYCKASNPHVDRLLQEDKGLRVVYRELPILGPDSVDRRAPVARSIEGWAASRSSTTRLWAAGPARARHQSPRAAQAAGIAPTPSQRSGDRGRAQAQLRSSPASSARPARRCSSSATG